MNQNQLAELFDTSVPNLCMHIANILKEGELRKDSLIKNYLTTASDESISNRRSRANKCGVAGLEEVVNKR